MSLWVLILLCVIQGLTEFLPVSSSGHLHFVEQIFGVKGNLLLLNLFLHVATLFAVVIYYRKIIFNLIKKPFQKYNLYIVIATFVTLIFAVCYESFEIDRFVKFIYCFGFLLTSIILLFCHLIQKKGTIVCAENINARRSIIVGAMQGLAVMPGLSRSGSTIGTMIFLGFGEEESSKFSFLLSIPIIVGGFAVELIKFLKNPIENHFFNIKIYIFAFFLTFFIALIAIKLTIKLLQKKKFIIFSIYTFIMFVITFVLNFIL